MGLERFHLTAKDLAKRLFFVTSKLPSPAHPFHLPGTFLVISSVFLQVELWDPKQSVTVQTFSRLFCALKVL